MRKIERLPHNLRLGGTPLHRHRDDTIVPEPDGVRRINNKCIELETYSNFILGNSAGFIGITIVITALTMILAASVSDLNDPQIILAILAISPIAPCIACILYFSNGAHRCRGTYIRIHRGTRKLYFIPPNDRKRLHISDWDQIEAVAGYIPIVSTSGSSSRHPLYLFGIDYTMNPPIEICAACGNLGLYDGDRSA